MTDPAGKVEVTVVGAGIVGLSTALASQINGGKVTVVDPGRPGGECSFGNAGYVADNEVLPLASMRVLRRLPRILLDPEGPLVVDPLQIPKLLPWAGLALRAMLPRRYENAVEALSSLNSLAIESFQPLLARADAQHLVDWRGSVHACLTKRGLAEQERILRRVCEYGITGKVLTGAETNELEPALSDAVHGSVYYPTAARCTQPIGLAIKFAEAITRGGGTFEQRKVERIEPRERGFFLHTSLGPLSANRVVVCAGYWSKQLMEPLGFKVPLETERGYHLMLPKPKVRLSRPVVFGEAGFVATPMDESLRLAGTVEFASARAPMRPHRAEMLFDLARPYLPGLDKHDATRWMGLRPTFPDYLPPIGAASALPGLFYAFGHQHLGLTQAAITARCITNLISARAPAVCLSPFDLKRFGYRRRDALPSLRRLN